MKQKFFASLAVTAVIAVLVLTAFARQQQTSPKPEKNGYRWVQLTPAAEFRKSYNFQLFSYQGLLWAFHPAGNYYSADGKNWTLSRLPNSISNLAFLDYVQFGNSILGLGHFEGNIEKFRFSSRITQTTDGSTWKQLSENSNLPARFFVHPVSFRNKLWLFGGTTDGETGFDDAWSSADGVTWKKEAEGLPFGKRFGQSFIVFQNKLYLLDNDVWVSEDGIHWKQLTRKITDANLFGYEPVVFDDQIWLLGCNRNGQFASKIYRSADGRNWTEEDAPWTPRGGIAATVHNGKLYMTGGKYGGQKNGDTEFIYSNDVWMLEKVNEAVAVPAK